MMELDSPDPARTQVCTAYIFRLGDNLSLRGGVIDVLIVSE